MHMLYACAFIHFALINFSRANGSELTTVEAIFSKVNFVLLKLQKFDLSPFEVSKC